MQFKNRQAHACPWASIRIALLFRLLVLFNRQTILSFFIATVNNIIHENKGEFRFRIVTMFGSKERMKWVVFFFTFNFIWEKHGIGKRNDFVVGTILLSILSLTLQCFVAVEVGQPDTKKRRRGTWQHIVSHEDRTRNSPSLSIQFW